MLFYNDHIYHEYQQIENVGSFDPNDPNVGMASYSEGEVGETINFYIRVNEQKKIIKTRYQVHGNAVTIACCNLFAKWFNNKSIQEALELDSLQLIKALQIPNQRQYCAILVEETAKEAIRQYLKKD